MGYHRAGFDIIGVDNEPQPRYPFKFIQADALTFPLEGYDAIHASPPCQKWVTLSRNYSKTPKDHKNYIFPIRERFSKLSCPTIIENVEFAPLINKLILCGTFFPELRVLRHRGFEIRGATIPQPDLAPCEYHPPVYIHTNKKHKNYGKLNPAHDYVSVYGNSSVRKEYAEKAMGIDWMLKKELVQSIPPAYTEYIGNYLLANI